MSQIAIKGATTGTGVFTLESPATNTDRTLILPDEAGTVLTSAGVPASAMPAGSVLQVVQSVVTNSFQVSGTFGSDIISASITPISSSNQILILANMSFGTDNSSNLDTIFALYRNGSVITGAIGDSQGSVTRGTFSGASRQIYELNSGSTIYLDSPSTTSAVTYSVRVGTSGTIWINSDMYHSTNTDDTRGISTLTVMEIGA